MPTPMDNLTLRCPAKLNLTLAVGPPRNDGLHPIASVMVAIDFGDDLHLSRLPDGPSNFTRRFADDAPKPQPIDWPIESDLVHQAHAMLEQAVGHALPVDCKLDKRIPAGSGLGGGSSNAAGMLVGLRELFGLSVSENELLAIAQRLGADVVFAVHALLGQRSALVTGIGEIIEPFNHLPAFHAVLIFPQGECPTAAVYHAFDQLLSVSTPLDTQALVDAWTQAEPLPGALNDLTDAAIQVCSSITNAMRVISDQGHAARLTGSGSALFVVVESQADAVAIAGQYRRAGLICCETSFPSLS